MVQRILLFFMEKSFNPFSDSYEKQYKQVVAAKKTYVSLRLGSNVEISCLMQVDGFIVKINNSSIRIRYPKTIWHNTPKILKTIISQNIAFSATYELPYLFSSIKRMLYRMPVPLCEAYLYKALSFQLPATAMMQQDQVLRKTSNLIKRLFNVDFVFTNKKSDIPPYNRKSMGKYAVMPFTFGKDSLLTFAVASELGIKVFPVYVSEPYEPYDQLVKTLLASPFRREFHIKLSIFNNSLGLLREATGWFGWEIQLTQYTLMLLPYVYCKQASYLLFSNEQSCNATTVDEEGFKCNPVFEQSHAWLLQNSLMASLVGGNSLSIGSFLEPIHDLAIMKILHFRYPEIAKYQSSCDLVEKPESGGRWCEKCTKCGRIYIFLLTLGINPKIVGFKHDLLQLKYKSLYVVFNTGNIKEYGYDQMGVGNDEQIFAFYLAHLRGVKGGLMKTYLQKYLVYAKKNEKRMRKTYFSLHSTKTIPSVFKSKVLKIYRQELDGLT